MDSTTSHRHDRRDGQDRSPGARTARRRHRDLALAVLLVAGTASAGCAPEPGPAPATGMTATDATGDGPGASDAKGGSGGSGAEGSAATAATGATGATPGSSGTRGAGPDGSARPGDPSDPESFQNHPEAAVYQGPVGPEVLADPDLCTAGPGKTVTLLEDPAVPEKVLPEVTNADGTIGGETVPGPVAEAIAVPERHGEAGCTVEFAAPGGCLGATAISPSWIPESVLPERVLPETVLPDGTVLPALTLRGDAHPAERMDGEFQEQVCRQDPDKGEPGSPTYVPAIFRDPLFRDPIFQDPLFQDAAFRDAVFLDGGSMPAASVPAASLPGMTVPGAHVKGASLEGYVIEGTDVDVLEDEDSDEVAYVSPGDVLFAPDEDEIAEGAEADLEAIVEEIRGTHGDSPEDLRLRVEGHTDDVRSAEHNQALSERRAEAVATWLIDQAGLDPELITTKGFGLSAPRADNGTEEGRALNRRVVITVDPGPAG